VAGNTALCGDPLPAPAMKLLIAAIAVAIGASIFCFIRFNAFVAATFGTLMVHGTIGLWSLCRR
jgi:hypothetical protein